MFLSSRFARCIFALSICFGLVQYAEGQDATTGSISGVVTDSSGALVKGATVTLINADRNHTERTLTTNSAGFYTATSLPLGTYTIKFSDPGFKTERITGLVLHVSDALTLNRTLAAGSEGGSYHGDRRPGPRGSGGRHLGRPDQ